ncbi:MAG: hypothetical protein ABI955_00865 [Nitrospirota bacterium]
MNSIVQYGGAWASAVATVLAVLVALFRDEIRAWWYRPVLTAAIRLTAPDCHKTVLMADNTLAQMAQRGDCYYFRIWVENIGRQRAEKVQVFVAKLLKKRADGIYGEVQSFLPMNLRWSHSFPRPEIFAEGLSPGMGKHCDFAHILEPNFCSGLFPQRSPALSKEETVLELDLEVEPNTMSHLLPKGAYKIQVKIAAANARPTTKWWEINLTGNWYSDEGKMFSEGIGIKESAEA